MIDQLNLTLAVAGSVVIVVGLLSNRLKAGILQEPIVATGVGIAFGPYALDWLDVSEWGDRSTIVEEAARITLAIGLMGVAMRLRKESILRLLQPVLWLVTLGMALMWATSSLAAGWLLGLPLWAALLVGAVISPTDPVVASSIVTGPLAKEKLPLRLRDGISFDSGANDGLAYIFVMLPIALLSGPPGIEWGHWLVKHLAIGIFGGILIGAALGAAAGFLIRWANKRDYVEQSSLLGLTIALTLLTLGFAKLLGADAIVSVFAAGLLFNLTTDRPEEAEEKNIQEAVAKLFTLPMFVLLGLVLPWEEWLALGLPLVAFVLLVLAVRRPVAVALLFPALRRHFSGLDAAFMGWFGPIGIAAIFYAALAERHTGNPVYFHLASAAVVGSILLHGVTAAAFTRAYARRPQTLPPATLGLESADRSEQEDSTPDRQPRKG